MELEQHKEYRVRIAIRPEYASRAARPQTAGLNGMEMLVTVAWRQDEGDAYPGEWALMRADGENIAPGIIWISSGDVELIAAAPPEGKEK